MTSAGARAAAVRRSLEDGAYRGVFPGATAVVGSCDEVLFEGSAGTLDGRAGGKAATVDTVYDVASLTKPLVTAGCLLRLLAAGRLSLDAVAADLLPGFARGEAGRGRVTVEQLLSHRSGLPAWQPYFAILAEEESRSGKRLVATLAGRRRVEEMAACEPLASPKSAGPGAAVYSDVGYIVLGALLQRLLAGDLAGWARRELAGRLGLVDSGFVDLAAGEDQSWRPPAERTAPCGICLWREREIRGVVQDENAYAMAGVAGHAGWFSSAREVFLLAREFLAAWLGRRSMFEPELLRRLWAPPRGQGWAGGWDTPSVTGSSAGERMSRRAVGHLGFTGSSLWIDLDRALIVVVLSNRVYPDRHHRGIAQWRPAFHDAVIDSLG